MSDESAGNWTVSGDIEMSDIYITSAEDVIFEVNRYLETHLSPPPPAEPPAVTTSSSSKGYKIYFYSMTHEDSRLWF